MAKRLVNKGSILNCMDAGARAQLRPTTLNLIQTGFDLSLPRKLKEKPMRKLHALLLRKRHLSKLRMRPSELLLRKRPHVKHVLPQRSKQSEVKIEGKSENELMWY